MKSVRIRVIGTFWQQRPENCVTKLELYEIANNGNIVLIELMVPKFGRLDYGKTQFPISQRKSDRSQSLTNKLGTKKPHTNKTLNTETMQRDHQESIELFNLFSFVCMINLK